VLLKALYAKAASAEMQTYFEVGFQLLSKFQDGVGATPVDAVISGGKLPVQADLDKLDKWLAWHKLSLAETEILMAEWKRFLAGEPI